MQIPKLQVLIEAGAVRAVEVLHQTRAVIADLRLTLGGLVVGLGFDREDTGWTDQCVIDIEAIADQIV